MTCGAALSFVVLLAVFEIGSCMRCYQCNSLTERECNDEFRPEVAGRFWVDCNTDNSYNSRNLRDILPSHLVDSINGAPKYCAKIVTRQGGVIRTCLDTNPLDPNQICRALERSGYEYSQVNQQLQHCSICERDLCNGSSKFAVSLPLAFLAFIISMVLKQ